MEPDGNKVRRLREERGLSVRGLAARAGVSTETVYSVEHGRRGFLWPETMRKLAHALGVDPRELVRGD